MIRKILIVLISLIFILGGLWNIVEFFAPILSAPGQIVLKIVPLVGGVLGLYAGLGLFRNHEFGRKFVLVLLYIRVAINALMISWWFYTMKSSAWLRVRIFDEEIYRFGNPYAYPVVFFAWIVIALLAIIFLSQKETRRIFAPETTRDDNSDIING
jgi:hypothetical protein